MYLAAMPDAPILVDGVVAELECHVAVGPLTRSERDGNARGLEINEM
jgi:hypothetical protein